ncbi:hypothetical protein MCOR14_006654 [Pyricularia oryzae]|nr:hypothetical protein MCOR14_006654 [Pyricularia oryzae]
MNRITYRFRNMGLFKRSKDKRKSDSHHTHGGGNGKHGGGGGFLGVPGSMPGYGAGQIQSTASMTSSRLLARLPDAILERIFLFVCPHTGDETYETCEQSSEDDACMLCNQRDLAHCAAVSKQWRRAAIRQLYHSIRIDSVHYCEREIYLSDLRKRHSFFDRNGLPEDTAQTRLKLLCRTLREDPTRLGKLVEYFKTPYMLRESCQADLARTIAVLPNLRYVDLPEGLFADDSTYLTLRMEVQARCHQLRKMTYMAGSERSLQSLASGNIWPNLEVLELVRINVDPAMLRHVLGALHKLEALKVSETMTFGDEILLHNDMVPPFPALQEFILKDVPNVSAEGLKQWMSTRRDARSRLKTLSLSGTGVKPWQLHGVLAAASGLENLTIVEKVSASLPTAAGTHDIPPLSSSSLLTLNYEITAVGSGPGPFGGSNTAANGLSGVTSSYYNYLSGSLLSGALPSLRAVYVRDAHFPDSLLGLPPPHPTFADGFSMRRPSTAEGRSNNAPFGSNTQSPRSFLTPKMGGAAPFQDPSAHTMPLPQKPFAGAGHNPRFSSNNPFAAMMPAQQLATLEVFTKGDDEIDWSFVKVSGGYADNGEPSRPHSSYGLSSGSAGGWGATAGARRSVFMGDGGGGFLAVPPSPAGNRPGMHGRSGSTNSIGYKSSGCSGNEWPVVSSTLDKRKDRKDLWR